MVPFVAALIFKCCYGDGYPGVKNKMTVYSLNPGYYIEFEFFQMF